MTDGVAVTATSKNFVQMKCDRELRFAGDHVWFDIEF